MVLVLAQPGIKWEAYTVLRLHCDWSSHNPTSPDIRTCSIHSLVGDWGREWVKLPHIRKNSQML